jgi:catalase
MTTPEEALAAINDVFGKHPGYRALHAKGALLQATFTATPAAAALTRAAHMQGAPVPALVRFSNGAGNPHKGDNAADVRGMAVKFTLPDGSRTDISTQTAALFTSRTTEGFFAMLKASKPSLASLWLFPRFVARHREFLRTLRVNSTALRPPASFATSAYHALHAYKWVDAQGGERFVRYHFLPEAAVEHLSLLAAPKAGKNYLFEELSARIAREPIRFALQVQVAGPGDSTTDPSSPWKSTQAVTVGTLEITGVETGREKDGDVVVFDPMRVTDGVEPSDDPILRMRSHAYSASVAARSGVARGPEAPPA